MVTAVLKKSYLELYALVNCFISMFFMLIFLSFSAHNALVLLAPDTMFDAYEYSKYVTNDRFCDAYVSMCYDYADTVDASEKRKVMLTEEKITKKREIAFDDAYKGAKRKAVQDLIWAGIVMPIAFFVYTVHWHMARRAHATYIDELDRIKAHAAQVSAQATVKAEHEYGGGQHR